MSIEVQQSNRLFLISAERTSYGMQVTSLGSLCHLYWGPLLTRIEDLPYGEQLQFYPFEEADKKPLTNQEYPPAGGYFFDEPCIKALYADGCRDTKLLYEDYEIERGESCETLTLILREERYPLKVRLTYRVYAGLDVIDRFAVLENAGDAPIQLEAIESAALYPPRGKEYRLTHLSGKWAGEYMIERQMVTQAKVVLESRRGVSGPDACPWFALDYKGLADEETGRVYAGSVHWSGNWKIAVERNRVEQVRVTAGLNDFDFGWKLEPGERFEAPVVTCVYSEEGFGGASRRFHRYQLEHLAPHAKAKALRKVMYNSWEVFEFDIDMEQQKKLADLAASIGVELFVMDDGWFGRRDNDRAGLGDWYPSKTKFPDGLKPLIDHVNALGMDFGIWVEPEMVNEDSDLYRAHPDWVLRCEGKPITMWRNQYALNFARDDVREYAWDMIDRLLGENNIAYLKWDMNRYLCEVGWPEVPIDRQREVWTRYVFNVWMLFDRIQAKYPNVILENCSSGGARIDLAMSARSDLVNTSDNSDPLDNLKILEGYTQVFSPKTSGRAVTLSPNGINQRYTPLKYRMHLCMTGTVIVGSNLFTHTPEEMDLLRGDIALYKQIRETTQNGQLYWLASAFDHPYAAFEFVREDQSEAVVIVLGQSIQFRRPVPRLRLRGLSPDALYSVNGARLVSGRGLMQIGVEVDLKGDFDSHLLRAVRV